VVAVVDETDRVLLKATPFTEDAEGYAKLLGLLGAPTDVLVAMEATGHYWKNLFAALVAAGFAVALLNPLRTRRFAGEDLQRTQTDAIDAVGIARLAAQKRPTASRLPDGASEELRELVRFRDRCSRTSGTGCASCTGSWIWGFRTSPLMGASSGASWRPGWRPGCSVSTPPRPAFTACRCVAWRSGRAGASRCSPRCYRSCCGGFSPKREFWQGILPGYAEYRQRVRSRLGPFIW
jgi:hypothetical protein